jgi:hypothetical protein
MSEPTRYRVANNQAQLTLGGGILAVDPAGPLVMYDDYARLKTEVTDLKSTADRLKAEVERLDTGIQPEGSNDAVGRAVNVLLEKEKEIASLKAEVERLRKAGDDLHKSMFECGPNEMAEAYHHDEWWKSYYAWNAAKEGKV